MKNRQYLGALFLVALPALVWAQSFTKYKNQRFGFSISLPSTFSPDPAPANGDGRRVHNAEGCLIVVSGSNNINGETLLENHQSRSDEFDKITYNKKGDSWYSLSGFKEDKAIYLKVFVGSGSINTLRIQYPKNEEKKYRELISAVSGSFRPGELSEGH